jgi:hypothetical protein
MAMLADQIDGVIGVDTLTAAAVTPVGGLLGQLTVPADGPATNTCSTSPTPTSLDAAALRWRVPAAMAPD